VRIARNTEGVRDVVDDLRVVGTSGTIDPGVAIDRPGESVDRVEIKIDEKDDSLADDIKDGARATGSAVKKGAVATGNAVKKGAEVTADGAKKVGGKIVDAVTDDDRDSDNDGK
jgi:hypothetical protein